MAEIKKVPRKLRNRETIMVDTQILRRRKMLRKKGIVLGKASKRSERTNKKQNEENAKPELTKRVWF